MNKQTLEHHFKYAIMGWVAMALLVVFNVIHWAMWVPALIACSGLVVSLAMQLNGIDREEEVDDEV